MLKTPQQKNKSERLFEATKFAFAYNLGGRCAPPNLHLTKTTTKTKTYLLRVGVG